MKWRPQSLAVLLTLLAPRVVAAQTLHVYGPEGNGRERRCIAVVERADGTCVPWEDVQLSIDRDATIELGERLGHCARWISVVSSESAGSHALMAEVGELRIETVVSLGEPTALVVHLTREGSRLHAQVDGVAVGAPLRGWAVWSGGRIDLATSPIEGAGNVLVGEVPLGVMVGVVVRVGERTGAAALAAAEATERPELLVIPSDLAVSAGSTARPVAFLVVADARGHLSRSVPLNIQSDRAALARLEWIEPGLAEVWLSTEVGEGVVDLAVHAGETTVTTELVAQGSWPVSATLVGPPEVDEGTVVDVEVVASALDGSRVPASSIELRWGEQEPLAVDESGHFRGPAPAAGPLVAYARIDGRRVPLAELVIAIRPRSAVVSIGVEGALRARIGGGVFVAIDPWARAGFGGVLSVRAQLIEPLELEVLARYSATWTAASPQGAATDPFFATTHAIELAVLTRVLPFGRGAPLAIVGGVGASADFLDGSVGAARTSGETATGLLVLGVGVTLPIDDGFSLGIDGHVRLSAPLSEPRWDAPALRFGIDVTGGFDVSP